MTATRKLTKTQRERLQWLAEDPRRHLIAYGKGTQTVYALKNAGFVERDPNEFQHFIITEAGRREVA